MRNCDIKLLKAEHMKEWCPVGNSLIILLETPSTPYKLLFFKDKIVFVISLTLIVGAIGLDLFIKILICLTALSASVSMDVEVIECLEN